MGTQARKSRRNRPANNGSGRRSSIHKLPKRQRAAFVKLVREDILSIGEIDRRLRITERGVSRRTIYHWAGYVQADHSKEIFSGPRDDRKSRRIASAFLTILNSSYSRHFVGELLTTALDMHNGVDRTSFESTSKSKGKS